MTGVSCRYPSSYYQEAKRIAETQFAFYQCDNSPLSVVCRSVSWQRSNFHYRVSGPRWCLKRLLRCDTEFCLSPQQPRDILWSCDLLPHRLHARSAGPGAAASVTSYARCCTVGSPRPDPSGRIHSIVSSELRSCRGVRDGNAKCSARHSSSGCWAAYCRKLAHSIWANPCEGMQSPPTPCWCGVLVVLMLMCFGTSWPD